MSTKCMNENCERISVSRGLCWNCYQNARNLIKRGKTTWEELISMGLAKECRNKKCSFISAFNEKKGVENA